MGSSGNRKGSYKQKKEHFGTRISPPVLSVAREATLRSLLRPCLGQNATDKVSTRELRLLNFLWRYLSARQVRKLGRG